MLLRFWVPSCGRSCCGGEAVGAGAPVDDFGFVDDVVPIVDGDEARSRAGGAVDVVESAAAAAQGQAMPVVSVIVPGRQAVEHVISVTGTLAARREMPVGVAGEGGAGRLRGQVEQLAEVAGIPMNPQSVVQPIIHDRGRNQPAPNN